MTCKSSREKCQTVKAAAVQSSKAKGKGMVQSHESKTKGAKESSSTAQSSRKGNKRKQSTSGEEDLDESRRGSKESLTLKKK
jgi:hypothetical protein